MTLPRLVLASDGSTHSGSVGGGLSFSVGDLVCVVVGELGFELEEGTEGLLSGASGGGVSAAGGLANARIGVRIGGDRLRSVPKGSSFETASSSSAASLIV